MDQSGSGNGSGDADAAYAAWNTFLFHDSSAVYSEKDPAGDIYEFFEKRTG